MLILILLPTVVLHLLYHLEFVIMTCSFLLEFFLLSLFLLLLLILHLLPLPKVLQLLFQLSIKLFKIDVFVSINLLVMLSNFETVIDFNLLLRFGLTCAVCLFITAIISTFDVWCFWLINFLKHATSFLSLFKFLLIPNYSLAVARFVMLLLHWIVQKYCIFLKTKQ